MQLPQFVKQNKLAVGAGSTVLLGVLAWLAFGYFGIQAAFIDDVVDESGPVFTVTPEGANESAAAAADDDMADDDMAESDEDMADDDMADDEPAESDEDVADDELAESDDAVVDDAAATESEVGEVRTILSGDFSSLNNYSVSGDALVLNNGTEQRFLRFENFDSDNGPDLKVYLRAESGEFISLGDLSGNIGNQNYEIPVDADLSVFNTVQIWCERFSRGFGEAMLGAS
ncbi:MAG: DM13 domain-containing protein [Actinomycetota bacterium]